MEVNAGSTKLVLYAYDSLSRLATRMTIFFSLMSGLIVFVGIATREPVSIVCSIILYGAVFANVYYARKAKKIAKTVTDLYAHIQLTPESIQRYTVGSFKDMFCAYTITLVGYLTTAVQFLWVGYPATPAPVNIIMYSVVALLWVGIVIGVSRGVVMAYREYRYAKQCDSRGIVIF